MSFPKLSKWLKIRLVSDEDNKFFRDLVHDNVEQRKKNNIVRNDMIHLLTQLREGQLDTSDAKNNEQQDAGFATVSEILTSKTSAKLKNWTDEDIVSQCMVFFTAGFSTLAVSLCFLCYELALNPDIQDKLYEEIAAVEQALNGERVDYETLQKMKYLDMIISEEQRKWPVAVFIDRLVAKQYLLEDSDGSKVILQPGESIWIPVFAIHRDPKHYPNPEKFDPERFSPENRNKINLSTYLPFGSGPRACVASRFALMQLKATIFALVSAFKLECNQNTQIPMKLKKVTGLDAENGFFLQFKLRN